MLATMRIMAACAVGAAALSVTAPVQAVTYHGYHIMPTGSYLARMAKSGHRPVNDALPMNYYGGSVFSSVKLVSVMWGDSVNPTIVAAIPGFSGAIVNSTYVDKMGEYGTHLQGINGHKGTNQDIARGTYLGQTQITPKNQNTSLTDADVQAELKYQIRKGNLPARDKNTLYMIYFPVTVSINLDGLQSCVDFGAYHFASIDDKLARKRNIFYAVEPDCHSSLSSITFAASHEYAEATTDNVPTPGSFPDFPQAWNDSSGFEIGDKCGGSGQLTAGSSHWTVTQFFLNSTGACSTGNYTSP